MQLNAHALPLRPGLQSVMQTTPGILPPSAQDRNPSPRAKPASRRIFVVVLTPSDLALLQGPPHTPPPSELPGIGAPREPTTARVLRGEGVWRYLEMASSSRLASTTSVPETPVWPPSHPTAPCLPHVRAQLRGRGSTVLEAYRSADRVLGPDLGIWELVSTRACGWYF